MSESSAHHSQPGFADNQTIVTPELVVPEPPDEDLVYDDDPAVRVQYLRDKTVYYATIGISEGITRAQRRSEEFTPKVEAIFASGTAGAEPYASWVAINTRDMPAPHKEQAGELLREVEALTREKGFLYSGTIMTYDEHTAVGSGTGAIYRETDPAIPVTLIDQRLVAEGRKRPDFAQAERHYTAEDIDRARRLTGKTKLDLATGRVTDEVDEAASQDPYYFLSPERRQAVIAREKELAAELQGLFDSVLADARAGAVILDDIQNYMDGQLTTPEMQARYEELIKSKDLGVNLESALDQAKHIAFESGARDSILTPQEIILRVGAEVDEGYLEKPYVPLALQSNTMVIDEIRQLRVGEGTMVVTTEVLGYERPFGLALEELDSEGSTVKDPALMGVDGKTPMSDEEMNGFADRIKMPFRR